MFSKTYKHVFNIVLKLIILFLVFATIGVLAYRSRTINEIKSVNMTNENKNNVTKDQPAINGQTLAFPINDFKSRITKKSFGTYVEPGNSPVSLERFRGYHTAVDVEYEDVETEVPVVAITDGMVEYRNYVSGYGGVIIIRHQIANQEILTLYGHLKLETIINEREVKKGQQIGILGQGYTKETDQERKHLHFGMIKGNKLNLRGYVQTKAELDGWYNPLDFYQ